uniref:ATP synthase F(0) complex subunit a n=2 Tax=Myxine glutinosa TaxID=7769 RepID=ATP6_MYXGL|nr:ATP synthase F0 subunit 6 [Myxine glutinosa]O63912.1 RecName: Full=ATP synthase subunit a; AltName: Full=F-ATPase protein 6 [Myxine glutinosa]QNH82460.1 ATP synthase F0 subunit 6 [Myxine glutinosa]CAA75479.1 ATPase 6 [Myxine glutinosa]CAC20654.1 ATPase subunit 6 [Myxine glutinosa]
MMMSLFNTFESPYFLGFPLMIFIAILISLTMFIPDNNLLIKNQSSMLASTFLKTMTKEIFSPIKKSGHSWALLLMTTLMFIFLNNITGLLPYTFTVTSQLSLNMAMAIPLWLGTIIMGATSQPSHSLAHLLPEGTPMTLAPFLIVIESISIIIRPLALGVRLTANITAGHLLIHLVSLALINLTKSLPLLFLTFSVFILLLILELAVSFIQAYVFVMLVSLYLEENLI